ncbi:MAG: arsenate reductase ArsC [Oligoflexia bacterium]|nr:arsenate reductase ArsC [Oligoflexia bacterium]
MNILFLCTGNSCRSQMAEGFGKALKGDKYNFYSAGTKKHGLNPRAIQVMKDAGVDITTHESNTTDELGDVKMDVVFTVCSDAHENCPFFPGGKIVHKGFDDPPRLTKDMQNEEEIIEIYSRVRDEIKEFVQNIEEYI